MTVADAQRQISWDGGALTSYSMLQALRDEGKDYIDCFLPLVLAALPPAERAMTVVELQNAIFQQHQLTIPLHSLEIILTRAKRQKYAQSVGERYSISGEGIVAARRIIVENDVRRLINELLADAVEFLAKQKQLTMTEQEVEDAIASIVRSNIDVCARFISPTGDPIAPLEGQARPRRQHEAGLLAYFAEVERRKPAQFETLKRMIAGSILAATVYSSAFTEPDRKMAKITAVLDSNFLFRVLSLDHDELNKPAHELFELMKESGRYEFEVFDFTVHEMVSTLKFYRQARAEYVADVKVGTIHSGLRSKGWTPSRVEEFIAGLDASLAELGIRQIVTNIVVERFEPADAGMFEELRDLKQKARGRVSATRVRHDVAAIEQVRNRRKGPFRRIEEATPIFVSCDVVLSRFDQQYMSHDHGGTIAEVIPDRALTSLLWLKSGKAGSDLALRTIISMHAGGLIIDEKIWNRFIESARRLREQGRMDDADVSVLLFSGHLSETLGTVEAEQVDDEFIYGEFEEARSKIAQGAVAKFVDKAKTEAARLALDMQTERERNRRRWLRMGVRLRRGMAKDVRREVLRGWTMLRILVGVGTLAALAYSTNKILGAWDKIEPAAFVISLAVGVLGTLGIQLQSGVNRLARKLVRSLFKSQLRKRWQQAHVKELHDDAANDPASDQAGAPPE